MSVWTCICVRVCVSVATVQVSHPNILDMFERARSSGLGGAVVLKERAEASGNAFVVGRIDRTNYLCPASPPTYGDRLEVGRPSPVTHVDCRLLMAIAPAPCPVERAWLGWGGSGRL